jgi:hypothetical protein
MKCLAAEGTPVDERFREHVESLVPKLAALRAMPPVTVAVVLKAKYNDFDNH